jgi:hypothetical protein
MKKAKLLVMLAWASVALPLEFQAVMAQEVFAPDGGTLMQADSPDHRYSVEIVRPADDKEWTQTEFPFTLVIRDRGKRIASHKTIGYLWGAPLWTDKYVAINNRRGNAGDYLWVFRLIDGKCVKPADGGFVRDISARAETAFHALDARTKDERRLRKGYLMAVGWRSSDELIVEVTHAYFTSDLVRDHGAPYYREDANHPLMGMQFCAIYRVSDSPPTFVDGSARKMDWYHGDFQKPCAF